jgi:hypothetical protein
MLAWTWPQAGLGGCGAPAPGRVGSSMSWGIDAGRPTEGLLVAILWASTHPIDH